MGGELVSSSKTSLGSRLRDVEESGDNRVEEVDEEEEDKKDENGRVEENSWEEGKIGLENGE